MTHTIRITVIYRDGFEDIHELAEGDSWRVDTTRNELVLKKPGGLPRELIPLINVRRYMLEKIERRANLMPVVDLSGPSDDLIEFENEIAKFMGDNFDGDEGQQAIIFKWLGDIEKKMRELSPEWAAYFFMSGPMPDDEEWVGDHTKACTLDPSVDCKCGGRGART